MADIPSSDPYRAPAADLAATQRAPTPSRYVGFWVRAVASMLDGVLLLLITLPLSIAVYGPDYLVNDDLFMGGLDVAINYGLPFALTLLFWRAKGATPGKMAVAARIVDAQTLDAPRTSQLVVRYLAYIPSTLVLFLGFLWAAWDPRKQTWHDKLAGTVVVQST